MKKLICKIFGHQPIKDENCHSTGGVCIYCKRCKNEGFLQGKDKQGHFDGLIYRGIPIISDE